MAAKIQFKRIAVIGAGTMGTGIAAQIANAGLDVLLLDLAANDEHEISPAEAAIERLIKSDPPQLVSKKVSKHIQTGPGFVKRWFKYVSVTCNVSARYEFVLTRYRQFFVFYIFVAELTFIGAICSSPTLNLV